MFEFSTVNETHDWHSARTVVMIFARLVALLCPHNDWCIRPSVCVYRWAIVCLLVCIHVCSSNPAGPSFPHITACLFKLCFTAHRFLSSPCWRLGLLTSLPVCFCRYSTQHLHSDWPPLPINLMCMNHLSVDYADRWYHSSTPIEPVKPVVFKQIIYNSHNITKKTTFEQ